MNLGSRLVILSISIVLVALRVSAQTAPNFSFKFQSLPASLLLGNDNNIIYIDRTNSNIKVNDSEGNFLYEFGHNGTGQQDFNAYNGLAMDNNGLLYIADAGSKRIQVFTQQGVYQKTIPLNNTSYDLMGLAFDSHSNLYVLDFWNNNCQVLDANGTFLRNFTVGNGSNRPRGLAIDKDDVIYVSTDRKRIETYNSDGNYIKDFASVDYIPGGLTVTSSGVYAIAGSILYHFLPDGTLAWKLGQDPPTDINDLYAPIAVFAKEKNIYLADLAASYIKVYSIPGKLIQQLNFTTLTSKVYGDADFELIASATSGLPIKFTSSNTEILSIKGSTAHILDAGEVTITATQDGDSDYQPAISVKMPLIIAKATQNITFPVVPAKTWGEPAFELQAVASSGLPVVYTVTPNSNVVILVGNQAIVNVPGTVVISATQPGNSAYFSTSISQEVLVNKKSQSIFFESIPAKKMGDEPFSINVQATSQLPLTITIDDPAIASITSSNIISILKPGQTFIRVNQGGNSFYNSATEVVHELRIDLILGIGEAPADIVLSPNPCRDFVILAPSDSPRDIQLFDSFGVRLSVASEILPNGTKIDLTNIAPGLYLISFENSSGRIIRRLAKI